ncbi:elongation factor P 5-aminopentanone reductase [Pontibacillus salicampi]|uniref:Elongation factor P 5-aminopentanone reductase n=1 Tax=Pontibacillus salicampi TaxID=1449801 RepID=A0ABV6LP63_9BACI
MKKNCLIIGASGAIGNAIATAFADEGYQLLLHYHQNSTSITNWLKQREDDAVLQTIQADLSHRDGIINLLQQISFRVDTLLFASGTSLVQLFQDATEEEMDSLYHVHVKTPWMVTNHLLPEMLNRKSGSIIVISSIWGEVGGSCEVLYSSVKGAQDSFVKALAKEAAPSGISVNGIRPGYVDTKMNDMFDEKEQRELLDAIPAGRFGTPQEVASLALFLASPASNYVNGQMLNMNGAWSGA